MKVFIAEKPSVAKAIATYLWPKLDFDKVTDGATGYYKKDENVVTWSFGHILGLVNPGEYKEEWAEWKNYPIFPDRFIVRPLKENKLAPKQFKVIKDLLARADVVVNAGDPDREGQLLVDEILELANYKGKSERIFINAIDNVSMQHAFENIKNNADYKNLYLSGQAREQADWLVGMNLTRAFTVNARKFRDNNVWRLGRVKTPTLSLIVQREEEIKNFKPHDYFELTAGFEKNSVKFTARLQPGTNVPTDSENRITDKAVLTAIITKIKDSDFTVTSVQKKSGVKNPPLPYSLDTLQIDANKKLSMSPADVLATVQKLYEAKIVSYPRSDCNYIPTAQKADALKILQAIDKVVGSRNANLSINSKCWNDSKITAHHAIIPTVNPLPDGVSENEKAVYKLIAERYLIQFYPPMTFDTVNFELKVQDEVFRGSGKEIKVQGFAAISGSDEEDKKDENSKLPELFNGENIGKARALDVISKTTTPPKRFSEGDLIQAMTNIHKYLPKDNPYIEKLKEVKGIGTPATRSAIIEDLLANNSKYKGTNPMVKKVKNKLVPTEFGINLIHNVVGFLKDPETTAKVEIGLSEVAEGKKDLDSFISDIENTIKDIIVWAESHEFPKPADEPTIPCPICKNPLTKYYSQKNKSYFWGCKNESCLNPKTGKKIFYSDKGGKPVIFPCKNCGFPILRIEYADKKTGEKKAFHSCNKCGATYNDKSGAPDIMSMRLPKGDK